MKLKKARVQADNTGASRAAVCMCSLTGKTTVDARECWLLCHALWDAAATVT